MAIDQKTLQQAADRLWDAEQTRTPCRPIRDLVPPSHIDDAYAVQQLNVRRHCDAGRRISGRKIGLTAKSVQQQMGVFEPDFGALFADMEYGHGSEIPFERLIHPRVEAEVMLVLDRDLNQELVSFSDVLRATAFAVASLEVVDCRLQGWDIRISDTVADNAAAGLYVVGASPRTIIGSDLANCAMTMRRNGRLVCTGRGDASLGHPVNSAVWLARTLKKLGTPLRAGDAILTGALGPMVEAHPGDHFEAAIDGLGNVAVEFSEDTRRE
jgi:2-keto-4-pentenoate hydratase